MTDALLYERIQRRTVPLGPPWDTDDITLTFYPQAWVNDCAMDVDPEGPTSWTPSAEHLERMARLGSRAFEASTYESDEWRHDPAAPEWVREWRGPFWIDFQTVDGEEWEG